MREAVIPNTDFSPSVLPVDCFKWVENGYEPETRVSLRHDSSAIYIQMKSYEKQVSCKTYADGGPVWCDSCMEAFFMPYPEEGRYLNIEINAAGATVFSIGRRRQDRASLLTPFKRQLRVNTCTDRENGFWEAQFQIPFILLRQLYGCELPPVLFANFYKCGDKTPNPHYGMWNEICSEQPDFHRPQDFGRLRIE